MRKAERKLRHQSGFSSQFGMHLPNQKDFFISYAGHDRLWAEWIAWILEEAGYTVVIQAWDFQPGGNFVLDMQKATTQAKRTIAVFSSLYLDKPFPQSEWAVAFAQDPTSQDRKLIPVRVEDCSPSGLLAQIVYVDVFNCSEVEAQQKLLAGVQDTRMKPDQRPQFPGKAYQRQVLEQVPFPGTFENVNELGEYIRRYQKRHGNLKVLGMAESVSLEKVYTTVQFLDKRGINRYNSLEEVKKAYSQAGRFQAPNFPRQEGMQVANTAQYLMILGGPGAGKSTFLRRVGLEALKGKQGNYQHNQIPVLIELKTFNDTDIDLIQAIIKELEICGFPDPRVATERLLTNGKLLLLLDGLDEVSTTHYDRVIDTIHDFVDRYDKNRFICSCRIAARANLNRFIDVEMADFDDDQIYHFITHWFSSTQDQQVSTAQLCWQLLQQGAYQKARDLAQTPLLLTFLCLTYEEYQTFPKNRADLYQQALDVLLKRWAADRRVHRDPIYKDLSFRREEMMLAKIAHTSFEAENLLFRRRDVADQISAFLSDSLNAPKHLDSDQVLREIEIQQGILVERNPDILSFSHLTLQEYLTAQYIADDPDQVSPLVEKHLVDERWQEVFLLVAGLIRPKSDRFLTKMKEQAQLLLTVSPNNPSKRAGYSNFSTQFNSKLRRLIIWANEMTAGSEGDYHPIAKRVVAIAFVRILALARALNHAMINNRPGRRSTLEHTLDLHLSYAQALNCAFEPNVKIDFALIRTFALDLARIFARPLDFERACLLAHTLEKAQIFRAVELRQLSNQLKIMKNEVPDQTPPSQAWLSFKTKIWKLWLAAFRLDEQWLELSDVEEKALQNYLYACELIVRCKESAGEVSPRIWEEIEEQLLTIQLTL